MTKEESGIQLKTSRIEALSDGIFAIAMTILIISFEIILVPVKAIDEANLFKMLFDLWPDFLHYVQSFIILGAFWIQHHNQFHFIKRANPTLLSINILGLMFIALIPFSTAIVGDYGNLRIASLIFECNLLAAGLVFYMHWLYVSNKRRLIDAELDQRTIDFYKKRNLVIPVVSVIALCVCFVNPRLSSMLYFSVPVILLLWGNKTVRKSGSR